MALGHRHLWRQRPVQLQNDLAVTDLRSSQYQPDQLLPLEGCQTGVDLADLAQSGAERTASAVTCFRSLESGRIGEDRGYSSDGFTQPSRDLHAPGQLRVLPIG